MTDRIPVEAPSGPALCTGRAASSARPATPAGPLIELAARRPALAGSRRSLRKGRLVGDRIVEMYSLAADRQQT